MRQIGLNLVTIRDGRDGGRLKDTLRLVKRAGFDGVGIWVNTIEDWVGSGRGIAQMAGLVRDAGLAVHEVCFVPVFDQDDRLLDQSRVFDWAAELGCPNVIAIYGRPTDPLEVARENWATFVAQVEHTGVSPTFEFIGPWPAYNSPDAAWEVVQAGPELGSIVLDAFHFWRGGGDLDGLDRVPGDRIALVHLNDVKDVPREEAKDSDRTYPGEGIIPLEEILRRLDANGFDGPLSVEIFGELQKEDPDEVAVRACETARGVATSLS
ncbi:MAG: sugar phosphate isomerase/epimerase family protein [Planctomycetota bacterium]